MLKVFTRDYDEDTSSKNGFRTYAAALDSIAEEINNTCESYQIINVDHTRITESGTDDCSKRYFYEFPFGTVTVLADVIPKKSDSLAQMFK